MNYGTCTCVINSKSDMKNMQQKIDIYYTYYYIHLYVTDIYMYIRYL